jgi:hypothetical protein
MLNNDLRDYIGESDMQPAISSNVAYVPDRFGRSQSALFMSNTYSQVPAGVYFNSTFTITAWVYPNELSFTYQRVLDFGNGAYDRNVVLAYYSDDARPFAQIANNRLDDNHIFALNSINQFEWSHLASVYNGSSLTIFVNGASSGFLSGASYPQEILRNNCYIGRSNWPLENYANAYLDDLKIYNRALDPQEILADMNSGF